MAEFLYHNTGDGTFEEVGLTSGIAPDGEGHAYAGMGVAFADYDNDGLPDLIITDLAAQMYAVYRNNGEGTLNYDTYPSGIGRMTMNHSGWGVQFLDFDNDGWKDLLIAQGHDLDTIELTFRNLRYREPMLLARKHRQNFCGCVEEAGGVFQQPWVSRGLAIGDIENDGRVDAVVTTNDGPIHVLHNETQTPNHWLTLRLVGHKATGTRSG
jgi:enediyne biosynthesis protein E4